MLVDQRHKPLAEGDRVVRWALLGVEIFVGLNAVGGGLGLMLNGLGMSKEHLADTPFDSFLMPGVLLAGIVGGSLLGAAALVWRQHPFAGVTSIGAGVIMLGWIAIESLMVHGGRPLQTTVASLSLITLALGWWLARVDGKRTGRAPL
jgi:hypothetical protein